MQKLFKQLFPLFSLVMVIASGCRKQEEIFQQPNSVMSSEGQLKNISGRFDSYVAQSWYNIMMDLVVQTPGHTPPIAARSFGYAGVTLYESLVGEMPNHKSLVGQLNGLASMPQRVYGNSYNAALTANAALARITKLLFPNAAAANMSRINALELANEKLYGAEASDVIVNRSRDYGRSVADAVFTWSSSDGGNNAYMRNFPSDFISPVGIDKWVPTAPLYQPAMLPFWGNNRTMVPANSTGPVDPPTPPAFSLMSGSAFHDAALEVYNTVLHLSPEQKTTGFYWADGSNTFTPPGHNMAIALQIIRNRNFNLYQAAVLLAKEGIALNDGGIVCWRAKYVYNLIRPITYIQTYIDHAWTTLLPTPPFPTYTSGHSTFSGASAAILSADIGDQVPFIDSTKMSYGFAPRSFASFNAAAHEAAISRLYGGIHYSFDNNNGFICGQLVAANVEALNW